MAAKATRAEFDARLGEVGGSLAAFVVLRLADEAPGGLELSQGQLAERMGVEAPTMVRHLDRLEKEGLIERRQDIRDREASPSGEPGAGTIVTLTADGDLAQLAFLLGREVQGVALSRQVENTVLHAMQA